MAITASKISWIIPAYMAGGFDIPMLVYNEGNSQTYKVGSPLAVSGGKLVEATAATPTTGIAGFALQAGQNIASAPTYPNYGVIYPAGAANPQGSSTAGVASALAPLIMVPAIGGMVFEGTFASNGSDVAVSATDVWVKYGLNKDSGTGYWYVDKNLTTTNASVTIVGIKNPQDLVLGTTTGARVFFMVNDAETIWT